MSAQRKQETPAEQTIDGGELFRALLNKREWAPAPEEFSPAKPATEPMLAELLAKPATKPQPQMPNPFAMPESARDLRRQAMELMMERREMERRSWLGLPLPPGVVCRICGNPNCPKPYIT